MKNLLFATSIFFFFTSCTNYESKVPLGKPGETLLDESFYGQWILNEEKKTGEPAGYINIIPFNESEYLVQVNQYVDSTEYIESILNLRMFPSKIRKENYYNLQILTPGKESMYMIYRLKPMPGNRYKLLYLSKAQFEKDFESIEDFREYVKNNPKDFNKAFLPEGVLSRKIDP